MKILVTGSNGQLGSEIRELSAQYPELEFLFTDFEEMDISDESSIREIFLSFPANFIINCAAYTAVDKAENDQEKAFLINEKGAENLAKIAKANNCFLIQVSTDYVFDGNHFLPYQEQDSVNPTGIYGLSKLKGEEAILKIGAKAIIIRTSWLYSSYGANFVKTMLKLGKDRKELNVIFDQIGTPTYAKDLAKAILDILPQLTFEKIELYHYSNEGVASWFDFAVAIMEIAEVDCTVQPIKSAEYPSPVKRPNFSVLDKSKIKSDFKIKIPYWKSSLIQCIHQIQKQSK